jgi:hypothetical protein
LETMIGIAVLLVRAGVAWVCFAVGVYYLTRTGREGMRIQRMETIAADVFPRSSSGTGRRIERLRSRWGHRTVS